MPTDQEMFNIEKIICSQEEQTGHASRGHTGKYYGWQEAEGKGRTMGESLSCGFHRKEWVSRLRAG